MRPTTSWSDLRGRRVGVWGVGVEGRANVRKLLRLGVRPILVDDRPPAEVVEGLSVMAADADGVSALAECEFIVKTPGKSRYDPAIQQLEADGLTVVGGLGLWLQEADRERVVCITGTKGKSTTTAILGHLLGGLGHRTFVGGNLGAAPYDTDVEDENFDYWVIEVSSYQATDLGCSPLLTAVTSLHPDHLTWHRNDPETYYRDKLSLCAQPGARVTVANGDSELIRQRAKLLGPEIHWVHAADLPASRWMDELGLIGAHNRRNALIARECLAVLDVAGADDESALSSAAVAFERLECRLETVGEAGGVLFVDDSLSTNVISALAAVEAFPGRRVALIVGGADRGIDYSSLPEGLSSRGESTLVVVTESECADRIANAIAAAPSGQVELVRVPDLEAALQAGAQWAGPDGVVVHSPAAPSFDRYRDFRERAAAFRSAYQTWSTSH